MKSNLNRWRATLLIIVVIYAALLTINIANMPALWDEVNHLTGGLHLIRGEIIPYFLTSSFYPPMFNLVTAGYFIVGGASVFTARLVAVTFALLSVIAIYELANEMYGPKTALLSAVLFSIMPGIVWLSRIALIETMLIFVFTVSMFYFYKWLTTNRDYHRTRSISAFAVGAAVKYQMLVVAPLTMIVSMLLFGKRRYIKSQIVNLLKFPRLIAVSAAAAITGVALYELYVNNLLQLMWFAIQTGTAEKAIYSVRFPTPIFYLIEMTWPNNEFHPISLLPYIMGLTGIALFAYRRKTQDKFLLIWFAVIYGVFTAIPNREWRYVTPLFPVLAISGAFLIVKALSKTEENWKSAKHSPISKRLSKLAAACLLVLVSVAVFFSCSDAYIWVTEKQNPVPVEEASVFATQSLGSNQSIMVTCPLNLINSEMVWFYINAKTASQTQVWQYPRLAADAYTPNFNITEFANLCSQKNVGNVMLCEYGSTSTYFNTTLTPQEVYGLLAETGRFTLQQSFGQEPNRVFVFSFT